MTNPLLVGLVILRAAGSSAPVPTPAPLVPEHSERLNLRLRVADALEKSDFAALDALAAQLTEGQRLKEAFPGFKWSRVRAGLLEIDKRYPNSARTHHLLARFAYVYGDRDVCRQELDRIGRFPDPDAITFWQGELDRARAWAVGLPMPY